MKQNILPLWAIIEIIIIIISRIVIVIIVFSLVLSAPMPLLFIFLGSLQLQIQREITHKESMTVSTFPLQWRNNVRDSVSNHQCFLNRLFRRRSKKTSKLRINGFCAGNSPGTGEFPAQMANTPKMFPFDDVIMIDPLLSQILSNIIYITLIHVWVEAYPEAPNDLDGLAYLTVVNSSIWYVLFRPFLYHLAQKKSCGWLYILRIPVW